MKKNEIIRFVSLSFLDHTKKYPFIFKIAFLSVWQIDRQRYRPLKTLFQMRDAVK